MPLVCLFLELRKQNQIIMKKIQSILLVAFLLLQFLPANVSTPVFAKPVQTQTETQFAEKIKKIEEFVRSQMKRDRVTGLTIGFQKDNFRWVKGFGLADLENQIPTKPESSYRMASVAKPMTAVGILTLVEQGKIDLDAEVQKYVPYFPKKKYPVTIRQLLGHLGGISHYQNYDLEGRFKTHKNTREAIRVFENFDLVNEPGTRYRYTSYGYNLLGAVIEGASGKSYGEYMTENVWKPLGMNSTMLDTPDKIIPNRVKGYRLNNGKLENSEFIDISSRFAAGGIRSTVHDMLDFAKGMTEGKLLTDKMREEMWTSQATRSGYKVGYGYGWRTGSPNGRFMVGHSGSQAETKTQLLSFPNKKFTVAVAINFENVNPAVYAAEVIKIFFDEPWQIRYYTDDAKDRTILRGLDESFDSGMFYFDRYGKSMAKNDAEAKDSFVYFKETIKAELQKLQRMFTDGNHPVGDEKLVKMFSFIAEKLNQNGKDTDNYYKIGVLPFIADYIGWYKTQENYSNELKFDSSFEQKITKWNNDWAKVWNERTKNFEIYDVSKALQMSEALSKEFTGKSVYPSYINDLDGAVTNLAVAGDMKSAFRVGQINYKLYPESDSTNATLGILNILAGQKENAKSLLKKSLQINPRGGASAGSLNSMAYNLKNIGQAKAGLQLLIVAVELHPKVANLYDSTGEFYMELKQNEKAIKFYEKALEIDPNYANASFAKRAIAKLKANK